MNDESPIEAGRESEVLALFAPVALGQEVTPGWALFNVSIEGSRIVCGFRADGDRSVEITLLHRRHAPNGVPTTASFGVVAAEGALAPPPELVTRFTELVASNDDGAFYPKVQLRGSSLASITWPEDGLVWCAFLAVLLVAILWLQLRLETPGTWLLLFGASAVGILLRLYMAHQVALGVWPYSRMNLVFIRVWHGPALAWLSDRMGATWSQHEVATNLGLGFALATPLALYVHSRYLLRDNRAALAAAWLIAILPQHVRFSHSGTAFIASAVVGAMLFATSHVALREPSRVVRAVAVALLPIVSTMAYSARPENVVFFPLVVWMTVGLEHRDIPWRRKALVVATTSIGAVHSLWTYLFEYFVGNVREGLGTSTVLDGVRFLLTRPDLFIPLNPVVTPPLVTLLGALGLAFAWRSRRRMVVFLTVWFLAFVVVHAYVVPPDPYMQSRYYLHMVVPAVFAAAFGLVGLAERAPRWVLGGVVAGLLASPWLHRGYIRDIGFSDTLEYRFVIETAPMIPEGCMVLEFMGRNGDDKDQRFGFAGSAMVDGHAVRRYRIVPIGSLESESDPLSAEARQALSDPAECVMYYEGLPCWGSKQPGEPLAPSCTAMHERASLETVATVSFPHRPYDRAVTRGLEGTGQPVTLSLYRVAPSTSAGPR